MAKNNKSMEGCDNFTSKYAEEESEDYSSQAQEEDEWEEEVELQNGSSNLPTPPPKGMQMEGVRQGLSIPKASQVVQLHGFQ